MKVSFINSVCKRHDAISEAVRGTMQVVSARMNAECRLYAFDCDFSDIDFCKVSDVSDILFDRYFFESDLILYHFGIYYALFNALLIGNSRAKQIVWYHNITPKEYLPIEEHLLIEKSLTQIANMECADEIWADSQFNKEHLVRVGIAADRISVLPLYVKRRFRPGTWADKAVDAVR